MDTQQSITLYKYLPFDEGSLCVLTEGTIKYTCPLDFNDPFDCCPAYCETSLEKIGETKRDLIHRIGKSKGLSASKRIMAKRQIAKAMKTYVGSGQSIKNVMQEFGVVCLSSDPSNILMWSHYAEYHKGFVVEFRIPLFGSEDEAARGGENLIPVEVTYCENRPKLKFGIDPENDAIEKIVYSKAKLWEYEREHRVTDHVRGPGIHSYSRDKLLVGVIAGMKMNDGNYLKLQNIVSDLKSSPQLKDIQLYRAEASRSEYRIIVPGHPVWDADTTG